MLFWGRRPHKHSTEKKRRSNKAKATSNTKKRNKLPPLPFFIRSFWCFVGRIHFFIFIFENLVDASHRLSFFFCLRLTGVALVGLLYRRHRGEVH